MKKLRCASVVLALVLESQIVSASVVVPTAGTPPAPGPHSATSPGGTLYIAPGGGGEHLSDPTIMATITVTVVDSNANPIQNYPAVDIWVSSAVPGEIALCGTGSSADANTDAEGRTTISGTIAGGGNTRNGARVFLAGHAITATAALAIDVNSPDINGDLVVNLADIGLFTERLTTQADVFPADFFDDDVVNLADIGIFTDFIGDSCQ